jgi:hypothetical protein
MRIRGEPSRVYLTEVIRSVGPSRQMNLVYTPVDEMEFPLRPLPNSNVRVFSDQPEEIN